MPDSGGRSLSARPADDQKLDPGYSGTCRDPCHIRLLFVNDVRRDICSETGSLAPAPSATQPGQCSHSGIARGSPAFFSLYLRALSTVAGGEPGGQTRPEPGDVPGVRVIVSQAGFPGPGCTLARASRDTAPAEGGRPIGLRRGPMLSPSPSVVVRARVGHPGYPA